MTISFFMRPLGEDTIDGRPRPIMLYETDEPRRGKKKKRAEYTVEPERRTVLARPAVESLLQEVEQKRRAKRKKSLALLLKIMLDED